MIGSALLATGAYGRRRNLVAALTPLVAGLIQMAIVCVTVFRITDRVLPAVVGGVIAVSSAAVSRSASPVLPRRELTSLVYAVALIVLLRATDPLPSGWREAVFIAIGVTGLLISRSIVGRTRGQARAAAQPTCFRAHHLLAVAAQYPFTLLMFLLPVSQIPWAQQMLWWGAILVLWALVTSWLARMRHFATDPDLLQMTVFPSALAVALSLNDYVPPFDILVPPGVVVVAAVCATICVAARTLPHEPERVRVLLRAHQHLLVATVLFGLSFLVFRDDLIYHGSGDTRPAELLPIALLEKHSLVFDGLAAQLTDPAYNWGFSTINGHIVTGYPIVPGLLNMPTYALEALTGADLLDSMARASTTTAALVAAVSVALMYGVIHNLFRTTSTALFGAAIFAFATCVWSVASKAMVQHGPSLMFVLGGLYFLTGKQSRARVFVAGLLLGLAVWNRPSNIAVAGAIALWWMWQRRMIDRYLVAGGALPVAAMLAYSWAFYGRIDTFGQLQTFDTFIGDPVAGFTGLLFSPNRGLFVFSPVFLLSLVGAVIALKHPRKYALALAVGAGAVFVVLIYSRWYFWWGGASFGYRLITEIVPGMVILAALGWHAWARHSAVRVAGVMCQVVVSVYIQWLGATYYPCGFDTQPNGIDQHPERLWDVANGEISRCTARAVMDARTLSPQP